MKNIQLLVLVLTAALTTPSFAQVTTSKTSNETLQFEGTIEAKGKSNFELSECIATSATIMGVELKTKSGKEAVDSSFVKGGYSYSYYADDLTSPAGEIKFKFEFIIRDGIIKYRFFDFEHEQSDSKFNSAGILPKKWNEKIKNTFSEKQYAEIMTDIKLNVNNAIRMINKYCVQ